MTTVGLKALILNFTIIPSCCLAFSRLVEEEVIFQAAGKACRFHQSSVFLFLQPNGPSRAE